MEAEAEVGEEEPWVSQEEEVCRHREWMTGVKIAQTCETAHEVGMKRENPPSPRSGYQLAEGVAWITREFPEGPNLED